jgi:hypothetical protein
MGFAAEDLLLGVIPHFEAAFAVAASWIDGGCCDIFALGVGYGFRRESCGLKWWSCVYKWFVPRLLTSVFIPEGFSSLLMRLIDLFSCLRDRLWLYMLPILGSAAVVSRQC